MPRSALLAVPLAFTLVSLHASPTPAQDFPRPRKVVLIAGKKSHGPVGNGIHDYGWSIRLLKVMLEHSSVKDRVTVETHFDGWPRDPRTLDDAATIMIISDGRDGDRYEEAPHLASPERVRYLDGLMKKGCGFLTFHFSTFTPDRYAEQVLSWTGGYFDWEEAGRRQWYSAITTKEAEVRLGTPDHSVARGLKPFTLREEFYYNIRFRPGDAALKPLLVVPALSGREPDGNVVAWARERDGGGRGFGTTCGHFYDNWKNDRFRKLILNAVAWTAHVEVPENGVEARFYTHEEIDRLLGPYPGQAGAEAPRQSLTDGRFGKALDARAAAAVVPGKNEYRTPPLTLECWARLFGKDGYNILVASDTKASAAHWEVFTMPGSGKLTAYLPGRQPDHVRTDVDVCDGRWHAIALVYEPDRVRLFADGKLAADQAVTERGGNPKPGDLALGSLVEGGLRCNGLLDEVRISSGTRVPAGEADAPFTADGRTVGLWHLDRFDGQALDDASALRNPARLSTAVAAPPAKVPTPPAGLNCRPADPELRAVLLDRSPDDAYLAVKADTTGRLFVGGRDAVFVFEPDANGGYVRRQLLPLPPDSLVIGLELRGNDLYVLTCNALYLVPEGRLRRDALKARRLVWGLPLDLHVSFHCLAWGPEGDLYLNHGDPLLNFGDFSRPDHWGHWTLFCQPEGTRVPYTGVGAVLRVRPDGSNLRVVSTGYRGPVGLAFDRHWNLFSNDNDHESLAHLYAPARLLHVTPHSDFAWPRGWMASKSPGRTDLLEPMSADLGRGVPCALAYYDEPFLGADYRHNLLLARWDRLTVQRHPIGPRGASYAAQEHGVLAGQDHFRPVGVAVGRGGRVFVTALYLAGNVGTPHCYSDLLMLTRSDDPAGHPFEPYDVTALPAEKLWAGLSSPSWERRSAIHGEILSRGGELLAEAPRRLAAARADDPALLHLPWLAGAAGGAEAARLGAELARHPRAEVRLQAVQVLGEFPALRTSVDQLAAALDDDYPRVQLAALASFFPPSTRLPFAAVVRQARSSDTYLRQTATRLLARRATLAEITGLTTSDDPATRLAGVLAAGVRLTVPPTDFVPPEGVTLSYTSRNAFFTLRFADTDRPVDLRTLGRTGSYTTARWWQAVRPTADQEALFRLLVRALKDSDTAVRLQAAYWLSLLRDARSEGLVASVFQQARVEGLLGEPARVIGQVWAVGPFDDLGQGFRMAHPPELGLLDLSASYPSGRGDVRWQVRKAATGRFGWDGAPPEPGVASRYLYFRLQSARAQPALLSVGAEGTVKVWHNGSLVQEAVPPRPSQVLQLPLDLQPGSNDVLVRVRNARGGGWVDLHYRARAGVTDSLPEPLDSATLVRRLREAQASGNAAGLAAEFLQLDWSREVGQGDPVQGRKLFGTLGCVKCHAVAADQKGGGAPSLAEARRRFTVPHLVESILLPGHQVAEPFRSTVLATKQGKVVTGLVVSETATDLEVLLPDATRQTVRMADVEERRVSPLSPMPAGLVKTPQELRDLLAYLLSENPVPP